ncbi:DUF6497 family protein [Tropicibacter naphthalenivorans]|uniref:DUF6497 family protein n=1 Tax=Tropicibacter naphthalenivorans TaxID=441103 RepID=UPI00071CA2D7|nr:DUF6497 family protein [Tropicibacter naphthalenivorans]
MSALSLTCGPSLAAEEPVDLGTGKVFDFHDMIDEAPTYRFRFVQPALGQEGMTYVDLADDLALLCAGFALPKLSESGLAPERVVISLMSAPTEFGVRNPEITQFFESFLVENDLCIWEAF